MLAFGDSRLNSYSYFSVLVNFKCQRVASVIYDGQKMKKKCQTIQGRRADDKKYSLSRIMEYLEYPEINVNHSFQSLFLYIFLNALVTGASHMSCFILNTYSCTPFDVLCACSMEVPNACVRIPIVINTS